MKRAVDYSYEQDLDRVSSIAMDMAVRVREEDPRRLFDEFTSLCEWHPVKAAQLMQCFAAFTDPDAPMGELTSRVYAITEDRSLRRTA
jgi:hypothetical protein